MSQISNSDSFALSPIKKIEIPKKKTLNRVNTNLNIQKLNHSHQYAQFPKYSSPSKQKNDENTQNLNKLSVKQDIFTKKQNHFRNTSYSPFTREKKYSLVRMNTEYNPQDTNTAGQEIQQYIQQNNFNNKINKHRRVRSSSKISTHILTMSNFFKQPNSLQKKIKIKSTIQNEPSKGEIQKQDLTRMITLKLKTQVSEAGDTEIVTYRQTSFSPVKSRYGLNLQVESPKKNILSKDQLCISRILIQQNQNMRSREKLRPNPKQWQFHQCLSLQVIELYSTNLKISCQGWVALDHTQLKYLRGWNPKAEDDFSPLIRLFITKISFGLQEEGIDIDNLYIRLNDKHIYESDIDKRRDNGEKFEGLFPHTIISLKKLMVGILLTEYKDLIVHSVLALGYILKTVRQEGSFQKLAQKIKGQEFVLFIQTTEISTLQSYCEHFQMQCKEICRKLFLTKTKVVVGFSCLYNNFNKHKLYPYKSHHQFKVKSTSLDMSLLFMKCLAIDGVKKILSQRVYETQIRFPLGWRFWERRIKKWDNTQYIKYRVKAVGGRNNKGNECFVVWDDARNIIISMADCKVNMHWKDTERIQQWVEKHIPRFSNKYYFQMSFYPPHSQKLNAVH